MSIRVVSRFLKQTLLNMLYLLLSFPLGIAYFVILVTGLSIGFGLAIILWGLVVLVLMAAVWWYLAAFERLQAIHLLGAKVKPMRSDSLDGLTATGKLVAHVKNPVAWTSLIYLFLKFPFGMAAFVVLSFSGALIVSPFTYQHWDIRIANGDNFAFTINTFNEALVAAVIGLVVVLPLTILFVNGLAFGWKHFAMLMLGDHRHRNSEPGVPPENSDEPDPEMPALADGVDLPQSGLAIQGTG